MAIGSGVLLPGVAENPTFPILSALAYTTGLGYRPTCDDLCDCQPDWCDNWHATQKVSIGRISPVDCSLSTTAVYIVSEQTVLSHNQILNLNTWPGKTMKISEKWNHIHYTKRVESKLFA